MDGFIVTESFSMDYHEWTRNYCNFSVKCENFRAYIMFLIYDTMKLFIAFLWLHINVATIVSVVS